MKILFIGDIVGRSGRDAIIKKLPDLKSKFNPDIIIANAENASALPQGFIGLFESEFPADISSVERISVLRRLTLWALFKGAVSTHLASEVLEEDEEDVSSNKKSLDTPASLKIK